MVEILGRSEAESHRKSVHRDVRSCHDYPLRLFDPQVGSPDTEVLHHHILEVPAEEPGIHTATLDDVVSVTFRVQVVLQGHIFIQRCLKSAHEFLRNVEFRVRHHRFQFRFQPGGLIRRRFHSREIIVRTDDVVDEAAGEPDVEGYVAAHEGIIDQLRYHKGQQCGHPDRQGSDKAVPRPTERPFIFLIIIVFDLPDELFVASLEQRRVKNKLDNDSGDRHACDYRRASQRIHDKKAERTDGHESHVDQYPSHRYERWLDHRYQRESEQQGLDGHRDDRGGGYVFGVIQSVDVQPVRDSKQKITCGKYRPCETDLPAFLVRFNPDEKQDESQRGDGHAGHKRQR